MVIFSVVIPILVASGYALWTKETRRQLPHWRNGFGLASMVIISADWLSLTVLWILSSVMRVTDASTLSNAWSVWVGLAIYGYIALPFALLLKGTPRFLVGVAWLLMQLFKTQFFHVSPMLLTGILGPVRTLPITREIGTCRILLRILGDSSRI